MFVSFDDGTCRKEPTSDDVLDEVRSVVSGRRRLFGLVGIQYTSLTGYNFPHWAAGNLSFLESRPSEAGYHCIRTQRLRLY